MKDWYTVPAEYGGRTFPLYRRVFIEWLWRRYGYDGLAWYVNRMGRRALKNVVKMGQAFDRLSDELRGAASVFDEVRASMEKCAAEGPIEGPQESANGD